MKSYLARTPPPHPAFTVCHRDAHTSCDVPTCRKGHTFIFLTSNVGFNLSRNTLLSVPSRSHVIRRIISRGLRFGESTIMRVVKCDLNGPSQAYPPQRLQSVATDSRRQNLIITVLFQKQLRKISIRVNCIQNSLTGCLPRPPE